MKLTIPTENGFIDEHHGNQAQPADRYAGWPAVSIPMTFSDVPEDAKTLAWTLIDFDAVPVSGFAYIHWLGANLPADQLSVPADASRHADGQFIQGRNSTAGRVVHATDPLTTQRYVGPMPPNGPHEYLVTGYALDTTLPLTEGYWLNEFRRAIDGHVVGYATATFLAKP
ncbi:YbhB/YbcL family Raf kinase inhibitor-like protein [Furfurilactobacillus entadae]|uniref:YbhB/YbcL family Raf kinase inhibitor-like protein n=1 Tax=Furfurilactobacillus entadae TaxID=2922307 RepID=UPI0035EEEFE8